MAVTSSATHAVDASPGLGVTRPGHSARRFVIGFLLGLLAVAGALASLSGTVAGRILPGVTAGGVDLGGLTPTEAHAALTVALAPLATGRIAVTSERGTLTLTFAELGRHADVDDIVAAATGIDRGRTRFEELLAAARHALAPTEIPVRVGYDAAALDAALAAFEARTERLPLDARAIRTETGYAVVPTVPGIRIVTDEVAAAIHTALLDPAAPPALTFDATSVAVAPRTDDHDARRARAAAVRIARRIYLARGDTTWSIPGKEIRTWITFGGVGTSYGPVIDPADVAPALAPVRKDVLKKPREATYLKTRSGRIFGVRASASGRALDVEATSAAVLSALAARAAMQPPQEPVAITMTKVAPELTTDEATKSAPLLDRIGTWTTYYTSSAHNGFSANITIPARKLDGVVIQPGQVLDFWKAIGEVSFRAGYKLGGAIVGGRTVEGRALAGGICATSTTLFNAAARGGLQILTRSPHWYYIPRYPLGLDATVSDSQTMRFRNDTAHAILITSTARPGLVRFDLWSVPNGRTVTWSRALVWNVVRGYDTVQYTSSLPKGARERIEYPVDGMDVSVTRTVRDADGRLVHRDTFVSHYHRMVGITLVGR